MEQNHSEPDAVAPAKCRWCNDTHPHYPCPYLKAIEFDPPGSENIRRVEFLSPKDMVEEAAEEPQPDYPRKGY